MQYGERAAVRHCDANTDRARNRCYTHLMSLRMRELALILLILVLPWQSVAAVEGTTAVYDHNAALWLPAEIDGDAAGAQHAHRHHAAQQHHDNDGPMTAQSHDTDSTGATHGTCTDVCCYPALAAPVTWLSAADNHGWAIPFAEHPLASRPLDCLEPPPRNLLSRSLV